jgi:hypothetical protein
MDFAILVSYFPNPFNNSGIPDDTVSAGRAAIQGKGLDAGIRRHDGE